MRKILLAALLCAAGSALSPSAQALTTSPDGDGVRLIPTHVGVPAVVEPVYYRHHRHRHWRRHYRR